MRGAMFARDALLPDGWARDVRLEWDDDGVLRAVLPGVQAAASDIRAAGPVIPGMPSVSRFGLATEPVSR